MWVVLRLKNQHPFKTDPDNKYLAQNQNTTFIVKYLFSAAELSISKFTFIFYNLIVIGQSVFDYMKIHSLPIAIIGLISDCISEIGTQIR